MAISEQTRNLLDAATISAREDGAIFWGFAADKEGSTAFSSEDWTEDQICAATVEAISKINPQFTKEA